MLVLALDTATPAITAALAEVTADGVTLLAERITVDARAHAERLAPGIDAVLGQAGAKPRDLGAVLAGVGPGPFTGLRVGLVTAAALADHLAIPAYGVCSLDGLGGGGHGRVLVATDARRKEVYWAVYADGRRATDPAVGAPADLPTRDLDAAVGDGALRYSAVFPVPVLDRPRYPVAQVLLEQAAPRIRAGAPGEPLTPLYLRRPDATIPTGRKPVRP